MLAEISSHTFAEWLAFRRLEPWGEERADLRAGIIASTMANSMRGKKGKPFKPQDFMPKFEQDDPDDEMTTATMMARLRAALGGR
jgi:hypothetical protein